MSWSVDDRPAHARSTSWFGMEGRSSSGAGSLIGYMRVSKPDGSQTTVLQRDALIAAGVAPERARGRKFKMTPAKLRLAMGQPEIRGFFHL